VGVTHRISQSLGQILGRRVVRQFGNPHGGPGRLAGWVMAHRSSNRRRNLWVVSLLDIRPIDRVLEIGFGPGIAVKEVSRLATRGQVVGVDHSEVMVRRAVKKNAEGVRSGRVDLRHGSVEELRDLDLGPDPFDKVFAVNSMGFWPDPIARLRELRRVLRPGGLLAIASQPRGPGANAETSAKMGLQIKDALGRAGFGACRVEQLDLEPPVVCVIASRPREA